MKPVQTIDSKLTSVTDGDKTIDVVEKTTTVVTPVTKEQALWKVKMATEDRDRAQARLDEAQADLDLFPTDSTPVDSVPTP